MSPILLLEGRGPIREALQKTLDLPQYKIFLSDLPDVASFIAKHRPALLILGPTVAGSLHLNGESLSFPAQMAGVPILLITSGSSENLAIAAIRAGVKGYARYPCEANELLAELDRCLGQDSKQVCGALLKGAEMIGESDAMRSVRDYLNRVAPTNSNILITGETGTGKELAAEVIRRTSTRKNRPFITVNCAAIPDSLFESELFGYQRGAFTGAQTGYEGKLKAAHTGTILLDEIGDMSPYAQAKILRVIDNKQIQRLGDSAMTSVDVRIIAATNQELETLVSQNKFRRDLFYRLNVGRVHLPPLRERKQDIPAIVNSYLRLTAATNTKPASTLTEEAWNCLLRYDWPGNVRELKNIIEIVCTHGGSSPISEAELPYYLRQASGDLTSLTGDERKRLVSALSATDWNKSRAAVRLRWSRMTLYRKMAKYQLSKESCASQL